MNYGFKGFGKEIIEERTEQTIMPVDNTYHLFKSDCVLVQRFMNEPTSENLYSISRQAAVGALSLWLRGEYLESTNQDCFIAEVRWSSSSANTYRNFFEPTPDGYMEACRWIDDKRKMFAESLVPKE